MGFFKSKKKDASRIKNIPINKDFNVPIFVERGLF